MPKRTNDFQRLIFLIKQQVADDAEVTESKYLDDLLTGTKREVDICIEKQVGGHKLIISIECCALGRAAADVTWVERLKGKHERLPTSVLVLVSKSGFTPEAEDVARKYGIETLTIAELNQAFISRLFGKLDSLWSKVVTASPTKVIFHVEETDGLPSENVAVFPDNVIFTDGGKELGSVKDFVDSCIKSELFLREVLARGDESHKGFELLVEKPRDKNGNSLCLRKEDPLVLREVWSIRIVGNCEFTMWKFPLEHGLLGGIRVSWGSGSLLWKDAFLVASEDEAGKRRLSITTKLGKQTTKTKSRKIKRNKKESQ
ncbi:MAG: hypothetical protein M3430_02180 [Acidobacteriota bacterium]|nr:hypothetical protein [Acidobacteriota bacterium]